MLVRSAAVELGSRAHNERVLFIGTEFSQKYLAYALSTITHRALPDVRDGLKSIEYQNLVGLLIESIKDQQKQINELKNRIIVLENKNNLN